MTTKFGTTPNQGDIVLVPVPFSDLSSAKRRPALVLSSTAHNRRSQDVIVASISSNPSARRGIPLTEGSLVMGKLPLTSYVRPANIYTLDKKIIVKRFGRVDSATLRAVLSRIDELFGKGMCNQS